MKLDSGRFVMAEVVGQRFESKWDARTEIVRLVKLRSEGGPVSLLADALVVAAEWEIDEEWVKRKFREAEVTWKEAQEGKGLRVVEKEEIKVEPRVEPRVEAPRMKCWRQKPGYWEYQLEGQSFWKRGRGKPPVDVPEVDAVVVQLKVVGQEEVKPAGPVERVVEIGNKIGELQVEQAALRAQTEVPTSYGLGFVTPGMAAKKPVVVLNELNQKHAVITNLGGKCVVMEWAPSEINMEWLEPAYQKFATFKERYQNKYVEVDLGVVGNFHKTGVEDAGAWWLRQPSRQQYDGLVLVPNGPQVLKGNRLNLWRGWGVDPREGDWSKMQQHMWVVLANEERKSFEFIKRLTAWKYQNPGERPDVALILKGLKGTGKGVFMYAQLKVFGPHGIEIESGLHLYGKHNKHLQNRLLVCADEAVWEGDKNAEARLKSLVTQGIVIIEPKGIDAFPWPNNMWLIQSTNDKWVVPATWDERRYAVFEVNPLYKGQKEYFNALFAEVDGGGAAAMLWDLLKMDLEGWHPRDHIPQTQALVDQKVQSLDGLGQWWFDKLNTGETPVSEKNNPRWVLTDRLWEEVTQHNAKSRWVTIREVGLFLKDLGCEHKSNGTAWGWIFPPIKEARRAWEVKMGGQCEWIRDVAEWNSGVAMDQPIGNLARRSF
jgi:hypothetical protein